MFFIFYQILYIYLDKYVFDINIGLLLCGGLMDKSLGLSAGRSGVRIPGKYMLAKTTAVYAREKYPL